MKAIQKSTNKIQNFWRVLNKLEYHSFIAIGCADAFMNEPGKLLGHLLDLLGPQKGLLFTLVCLDRLKLWLVLNIISFPFFISDAQ